MAVELIGRNAEVTEVITRLQDRRLVTVIGPAGIGKTTLALTVARETGSGYPMGSHTIDLSRVDAAEDVAGAIAAQLGFNSFDALINAPSEQPALVVVDNCEHVTAAAADAVAELLAACESPRILATSRSPLDVPGESLVMLGPLGVPPPGTADRENDAVRLFLDRVRDAGAAVDEEQLEAVAQLCRRLDGVPLALELAAAQTRTMLPADILDHLDDGMELLQRPRFRGHRRHRSLSETVDWSYRLLPSDAAALFDRLGVFAGPFTADLAAAVAADAGLDRRGVERGLGLLVDSSLLMVDRLAATTQFRLLETMRMYARSRLTGQGLWDQACGLLANHVASDAENHLAAARRWDRHAFGHLFGLYDTAAASLRWSLAHDDDGERGLRLCALFWGVVHQGHTAEIAALCDTALRRWGGRHTAVESDATATAATARFLTGDTRGAWEMASAALAWAGSSSTAPITLRRVMAYAARALDDSTASLELFGAVAGRARAGGLMALALEADVNRAQLIADAGDLPAAFALAEAARSESVALGSPVNEVWARSILAQLELRRDAASGIEAVTSALDAARHIEYPAGVAVNLRALAWARTRSGHHRSAAAALTELFDDLITRGGAAEVRGALLTTADLLHAVRNDCWKPLAATALSLPQVGPTNAAMDAMTVLPASLATPLTRREAIAITRRELRGLLAGDPAATAPVAPTSIDHPARLIDRGQFWEVQFAGRGAHLKSSKGLTDVVRLISAAGREIHCTELMNAVVEQPSSGEAIDQQARRSYEQRIRDLQEDIDAAEADGDPVRADRARAEMDALVDHLTAALGLGGRARRVGGSAERARSAVTQRIRSTIRSVTAVHPELGLHLEKSVRTGSYCVYRPENAVSWQVS